jgi:SPP1 gp7 family putative phage head morphogenesis protein
MADKARQWTDAELERMENHLANIYSRAYKEVKVSWDDFLEDAKEEADKLLEAINNAVDDKEKKKAKQAYQKFLREKTLKNQYYKDLVEEITGQILNINQTALDYINDKLPDIYVVNYNAIAPSVENIIDGYSFNLVDANTIRNLATKDDTLLPYKTMDGKKDVRWNTKRINAEVLQGILQGEEIPKIAKRLEKVMDMNEAAAIRNARTTVTSAECKGRQDSYVKATNDGIILKRRWIATKDNRTRHWHADLDGVEVDVDEPFINDFGEIMQPGDPHADPANVYNCRCSIRGVVLGFRKVQK